MKKHAFKRITAIVLVFVMCVFLMPTNSLGVKAVTADDVLVEESRVSSEIGAENPASEVEVIASEEADLPAEELALDEDVEEVSEETEEVEPLDALSENGTILLADEVMSFTLSYGEISEVYASLSEVSARIDELNNVNGVYTITCTQSPSMYVSFDGDFPTKASEIILDETVSNYTMYYVYPSDLTTDIKLTLNASFKIQGCASLSEVEIEDNTYHELSIIANKASATSEINKISGYDYYLRTDMELNIDECYLSNEGKLYSATNEAGGAGHFVIDKIYIYEDCYKTFRVHTDALLTDGRTILTTNTDLSEIVVNNDSTTGICCVETVKSGSQYLVKVCEFYGFTLCYEDTNIKLKTYQEVKNKIEELDGTYSSFEILIANEQLPSAITPLQPTFAEGLPDTDAELVFKAAVPELDSHMTFVSENAECSLRFPNTSVQFVNCNLGEVEVGGEYAAFRLGNQSVSFEGDCSVTDLTLDVATNISIYGSRATVGNLVYTGEYRAESSCLYICPTYEYDSALGEYTSRTDAYLKVNNITKAYAQQDFAMYSSKVNYKSNSNPDINNLDDVVIFELENYSSMWEDISFLTNGNLTYDLIQTKSANGNYVVEWTETTGVEIELVYGTTTEKFYSLEKVFERINALNNADTDYFINFVKGDVSYLDAKDIPDVAKSITFQNYLTQYKYFGLTISDTDGQINVPVKFVKVGPTLSNIAKTKDITIIEAGIFTIGRYDALTVDGALTIQNVSNVQMFGTLTADTLCLNPTSSDAFVCVYSSVTVDNLDIASGSRMQMKLEGGEESQAIVNITNYSEDCERLDLKCLTAGYETVMTVDESDACTIYTKVQEAYYYVTDSEGNVFIASRSWLDVEKAFELSGDKSETYTIKVANDKTIGKLPANAAKIILAGDEDVRVPLIRNSSETLTAPVELEIQNATLVYGNEDETVNVKLNGKTLTLDNVYNIGAVTGGNGNIVVKSNADAVKIDKLKSIVIEDGCALVVMDTVTNVASIRLDGSLYAWGNITITNILCDEEGELYYNIDKKLTINGTVTFDEGADSEYTSIILHPYQNYQAITAIAQDVVVIDVCAKADVSDFYVAIDGNPYVLYRSKTALKTGIPNITVFENYGGDWTTAEAYDGTQFATINDAIVHVNEETEGEYIIRLEQDVTTTETLKTIQGTGDKLVLISTAGEDMATLTFKGTFIVDGTNVEIMNVELRNSAKANASVTLKNGANVALSGTAVNALTAPAGTGVYIGNLDFADVDVVINGTVKCSGEMVVADDAVLWCKSALTTGDFTLNGNYAEVRILTGKAFTINGNVNIGEDSLVCINRVDKEGNLATIKAGTAMVTADKAVAGQFYTQNIMTGTEDVYWLLTKSGKVIKTAGLAAYAYVEGERNQFNPEFASFNEAKEYVAAQTDGEDYVIELLCDSSGADLTDLPENLVAIVKSESATAESVKLTTSLDVTLSTNLMLDGVNLAAGKKTIYANNYGLYVDGNGGITAARAKELIGISVNSGTVTFTAKDSTINYIEMGVDGTFKCPAFTGFAQG